MQLAYHKGKNVGDAINPFIFNHFLGEEFFDGEGNENLLGIGSILGLKAGLPGRKIVFSSGWGGVEATYGKLPRLNDDWDVRSVRGPLSASALELPETAAVIDGAYLVLDVWPRIRQAESGRIGFIPHHKSLDFFPYWEVLAEEAGLVFLDVRLPPRDFMERLWRCESVLAEAVHGAIFADAYGIPWVPVRLYGHISEFKWKDWWSSLGIEPVSLHCPVKLHSVDFLAAVIRKRGFPAGLSNYAAKLVLLRRHSAAIRWLRLLRGARSHLSDRARLESLIEELRIRLRQIRSDYQ